MSQKTTTNPNGVKVFKKWSAKEEKKRVQAEREEAIRREAHGIGYQAGLAAGFADGLIEGVEVGLCDGHSNGVTRERTRWTTCSFWARLRYLINPNHTI